MTVKSVRSPMVSSEEAAQRQSVERGGVQGPRRATFGGPGPVVAPVAPE